MKKSQQNQQDLQNWKMIDWLSPFWYFNKIKSVLCFLYYTFQIRWRMTISKPHKNERGYIQQGNGINIWDVINNSISSKSNLQSPDFTTLRLTWRPCAKSRQNNDLEEGRMFLSIYHADISSFFLSFFLSFFCLFFCVIVPGVVRVVVTTNNQFCIALLFKG